MLEFIYLILFRWLSGAQNGLGYGKHNALRIATSVAMLAILAATGVSFFFQVDTPIAITAAALVVVSMIGAAGVEDAFNEGINFFPKDIHLFEILATGGVTIAWAVAGGNLVSILCATYPGLIVHKGFINLGSGLNFFYHGTDDATGRTFSIPLLGIKVPRLSQRGRIIAALVSVVAGIAAPFVLGDITIYSLAALVGINL